MRLHPFQILPHGLRLVGKPSHRSFITAKVCIHPLRIPPIILSVHLTTRKPEISGLFASDVFPHVPGNPAHVCWQDRTVLTDMKEQGRQNDEKQRLLASVVSTGFFIGLQLHVMDTG